jgi:hypothetical protein
MTRRLFLTMTAIPATLGGGIGFREWTKPKPKRAVPQAPPQSPQVTAVTNIFSGPGQHRSSVTMDVVGDPQP